MEITQNEAIMYGAIGGAVIGLIFGAIVLIVGIKKGKKKLGIIGFVSVFIAGPISGIVSIVVAAVFLYLIMKKNEIETSEVNMSSSDEISSIEPS